MLLTCSVSEYYRNLPAQSTNFSWLARHPQKRPFQYWGHTTTTEGALGSHNPQIASEISVTLLFCTLTRLPNALITLNAKCLAKNMNCITCDNVNMIFRLQPANTETILQLHRLVSVN